MTPPDELTITSDMQLRQRLALAWRILRRRRVTFTVKNLASEC